MESFYSTEELKKLGLKKIGNNVKISRKTSIYSADNISIGDYSRIDDFSILSGNITIGRNVHIAAYTGIFAGSAGVKIDDFCGVSAHCNIYAASDDYTGLAMTNPTIPEKYKMLTEKKVTISKHALVGAGCTILPGVNIGEGASFGSMSLINKDVEPWTINVGIPAKAIKERSKNILELEKQFLEEIAMETKQE